MVEQPVFLLRTARDGQRATRAHEELSAARDDIVVSLYRLFETDVESLADPRGAVL